MNELSTSVGIGWRPEIAGLIGQLPGLRFCEVVAENIHPAQLPQLLQAELARGVQVIPHGISLSLGGAEPVDPVRIEHLAHCAAALDAPLVSEHIAFVRAGGIEAGHLLPVARTRESLDVLVANVRFARSQLPVPLALEPIAALFDWPDAEFTEAEFVTELLDRTGALLLLDIANIYGNAVNAGLDPRTELSRWPLERIAYCHVAGGTVIDGLYHDSHTDPVHQDVLDLVKEIGLTTAPVMLERDGNYPGSATIRAELDAIADAAGYGRCT